MAKRKFEWKKGWPEVRERKLAPSSCSPGNYRRDTVSEDLDVSGIFCCPRGTKLKKNKRGCYRDNKKVSRMKLQSLRHGLPEFKQNHPKVWKKLQSAKPNKQGVRIVQADVK